MLKQWLTVKKASQSVHGYAIYLYTIQWFMTKIYGNGKWVRGESKRKNGISVYMCIKNTYLCIKIITEICGLCENRYRGILVKFAQNNQ